MLSKKQARAFFLGGTLVTFLIFIGLTIYSFTETNDQSNEENLSASAIRGKVIWEENNCMGCHTILGEGAYYAPELTKVIDRLDQKYNGEGEAVIKGILMSEVPWQPNGRKMVAYGMSEQEAEDVVEFLKWIGEIDLNGFDRVVSPLAKDKMNQ
ncbi:c-type cytochrome [Sediminicola luteus]|uniref:Nitric oxide reductase n=1 Tax=Sediminicola luteus TaxID=319238 RepID=A0A2A4GCN5_9FLAO|nr:cytochrome c [Sediminicola luteus]PCE66181.1 nitric oxide reductase [Sediminicola luteus]